MRMSLAEALTNMAGVVIKGLNYVQVSANWMAASGDNREDLALRKGVEALSKIAVDLSVSIPVGKDSLSMKTKWSEGSNELEVTSPLSGVVTAMAPVGDISIAVTPELHVDKDSTIILVKLNNASRLSGSIFSEVTQSVYVNTPDIDDVTKFKDMFLMVQQLIKDRKLLALHDISDGGLITTLAEMCFTKKIGMDIDVSIFDNTNESLFSEEIGFVLQASNANCDEIISSFLENNLFASKIASLADESLTILKDGEILFNESINSLEKYWRETSHAIQSIRDNKTIADSELNLLDKKEFTGLSSNISFDESQIQQINTLTSNPKVAILREQGVNGQNEMAAAFTLAGFEAVDVHMQDLLDQNIFLKDFQGMAVCGGFSYGDVLGAGGGWSKTVMYNTNVKDQFEQFFQDQAKFTLGVCNGCQMLSNLKQIIPDAEHWPSFKRNLSDQFEARLAQVKIEKTNSVLLENMEGWMVPVASAHGEGRASFEDNDLIELQANNQVAMRFADSDGESSEIYPINPNGSPQGITGITAANGRITIMMPHPERVFRKHQMSWHNKDWQEFSPWMQIFVNARKFSEGS